MTDPKGPVNCVAFAPDGKVLASGGGDLTNGRYENPMIRLWDVATGKETAVKFAGHKGIVMSVTFGSRMKVPIPVNLAARMASTGR